MRELKSSDRNVITVRDGRTGTDIELYYRSPTSREEVLYQSNLVRRKGKKVVVNAGVRVRFALDILTGFRDGDFGYEGRPISSNPESPNYREDWKEIVKEGASDILRTLSLAVFEGTKVETGDLLEMDFDDEIVLEEDAAPLERS